MNLTPEGSIRVRDYWYCAGREEVLDSPRQCSRTQREDDLLSTRVVRGAGGVIYEADLSEVNMPENSLRTRRQFDCADTSD